MLRYRRSVIAVMELSKRCAHESGSRDWHRGEEYFRRGAVEIIDPALTGLKAAVQGSASDPYIVELDWSKATQETLFVSCSCPRFDDVGVCKHIIATILAADAAGLGKSVPGRTTLYFETSAAALERFADADEDEYAYHDEDEDEGTRRPSITVSAGGGLSRINNGPPNVLKSAQPSRKAKRPAASQWKKTLSGMDQLPTHALSGRSEYTGRSSNKPHEIWYLLDLTRTAERGWPSLSLHQRILKKDGTLGKLKPLSLSRNEVTQLESVEDQALIGLLAGNERTAEPSYYGYSNYSSYVPLNAFAVAPEMFEILMPKLSASGRLGWLPDDDLKTGEQVQRLTWDDGPAWKVQLSVAQTPDQKHWELSGRLEREGQFEDLSRPLALLSLGLVVFPDRIARFDNGGDFRWAAMLRTSGPLLVPVKDSQDFIERLAEMQISPGRDWPSELQWEEETAAPAPQLKIATSNHRWTNTLECGLSFRYGDRITLFGEGPPAWYDRQTRRALRRDLQAERAARDLLLSAGAERQYGYGLAKNGLYSLAPARMPRLVQQLTAAGWQVTAEGRLFRRPGQFSIRLTSNVDWFDLEVEWDFEGVTASLPRLLSALRRGDKYVQLDDGSQGILPEEWLARYACLAELGQVKGDRLKFLPTQAALLDALLAAQENPVVSVDQTFVGLRDKLRSFDGIRPCHEPRSFAGELRQYQREGLGWLHFLDEYGFGGCLADDMGLGKTVQILAFLDERRGDPPPNGRGKKRSKTSNGSPAPSLVVVPRSLVFNWIEEARRFTPELKVLNYTGLDRAAAWDQLKDQNLVITTYGTVRRDIVKLREFEFDYVILDEAQAIKNAASQAAKACRLLPARRRLALTGTPVENHLGELWSLFEFLNPGMLGRHPKMTGLLAGGQPGRNPISGSENDPRRGESLAVLGKALRPFLLRRTKKEVLTELPEKTEQTLYCELDGAQRELYGELRDHYRQSLLDRVNKSGLSKSKIHVLEALLRLRQAACHPGLLDRTKIDAGSAKLQTLLEQLAEVVAEGHKALVFSQFTSLLAIVRGELDRREIVYEYLDGKTVKRQAKVERFQADPDCRLFLISLKAGGQGLNLTAADYVFILDPWWNPAVEAQAVDRAHRIGQDRHVFAYRLIARDTVEEKILQLQAHKRDLAKAIVSGENALLRDLTVDDLQLLLS
jgi:superfamily II DNA or RNA helicase